jgi:DNA-binding beta-propeller fold protein YncE
MSTSKRIVYWICIGVCLASCRKDPAPIAEQRETLFAGDPSATVKGMYVLNEGNLNSNKASLDYVDFTTGIYTRNIYSQANPEVTKGLGDVGNDIGIYGSKLYIVVNNSNKVEVLDVRTCKRIQQINIINCRYICFSGGKAFVSAYLGKIGDPHAPLGIVAEIDTVSLTVTRQVTVGRQPEEMAVVGQKLYVANSGGYSPPDYERTISVIDIPSFSETSRIDVGINLDRLKAAPSGNIYVTSRGDYYTVASSLFGISTQSGQVYKDFALAASNLWIDDDIMYVYSTEWNYNLGKSKIAYAMISIKDDIVLDHSFITDGTEKIIAIPYGIAVNPVTKDIFVTDAKEYAAPGTLYCFDKAGNKKWSVQTGDIPGHFAFVL